MPLACTYANAKGLYVILDADADPREFEICGDPNLDCMLAARVEAKAWD